MPMLSNLERLASNMRLRKLNGHRLYGLLLLPLTQTDTLQEGYQLVAWLLQEGYFTTVVTLNNDTQLEDMLSGTELQATILEVGRDATKTIVDALESPPPGVCIIKLPSAANDDPSPFSDELQNGLKSYLQNALVAVGPFPQYCMQILHSATIKSIFHVLSPSSPSNRSSEEPGIFPIDQEFTPFFAHIISLMEKKPSTPHPTSIALPDKPRVVRLADRASLNELQKNYSISHGFEATCGVQQRSKMQTDILLATVTPIETRAVLKLFPEHQTIRIRKKIYHDLGTICDARIVLVQQPHMGSSGVAGSHVSIKEALHTLSPIYVIMVGIAFGFREDKQHIGDILVSQHIQDYEPQRISQGLNADPIIEARGDRVMASTELLDLFIAGQYSLSSVWTGQLPEVHIGPILSGAKLVDQLNYRNQLQSIAPDAIGGEMEGIGLYYAAIDQKRKVHWILVKGISDWADGNKNTEKNGRQQLAATNAARFTYHVLECGGFEHRRSNKRRRN